jgi:hypothetical protein
MINLLPQLISLSTKEKSKTKIEKFLFWFKKNEDNVARKTILIFTVLFSLIFSIVKNHFIPKDMEWFPYVIIFMISYSVSFMPFLLSLFFLSNLSHKREEKNKFENKKEVLNYLQENSENQDMKEFLIKIKLIHFFNTMPESYKGYADNLFIYLNIIDNNTITPQDYEVAQEIINSNFLKFLEKERLLLEKSIDDLKLMIKKEISKKLKEEKDNLDKVNSFINDFSNDEMLFQKEKSLSSSL